MGLDILCIGAPKAGTTWLYSHLAQHPKVWMSLVKELHYFDKKHPIPRVYDKKYISKGILGIYKDFPRRMIVSTFGRAILSFSIHDLLWLFKFYSNKLNDSWYESLFVGKEGFLCGEMTTDYCALSIDGIRNVFKISPKVKIIFLLRNPVDRSWSHARMLLPELINKPLEEITNDEFINYITHDAAKIKSEYIEAISKWEEIFPKEQIFIGFYDEIVDDPERLLINVFEFLGLSTKDTYNADQLKKRVNKGKGKSKIPDDIRLILSNQYLPELRALSERFGGYPVSWLQSEQEFISNHQKI